MRRHKTVAQIFLVLSVVNFTFASPVQPRTMHEVRADLVTKAEGGTQGASEKPHTPSEELSKLLERRSTGQDPPEPSNSVMGVRHTSPTQPTKLAPRADPLLMEPVKLEDKEATKFFNEELKRKMKEYVVLGTVAGIFAGIANGIQKQIMGTVSPGAQTVGRAFEILNEHPQDNEDLVSRSLSSLGDEDLQMLSVVSRRMLDSLD